MLIPFTVDTVFDSLLRLKMASGDSSPAGLTWSVGPGAWRAAYARALPADQPEALRSAELALEAAPRDPERQAVLGRVLFERQEYPAAAAHLDSALAAGDRDPGLLLTAALAQVRLEDLPRAKVLLERVRASGGDSSFAAAVLAEIAANAGHGGDAGDRWLEAHRRNPVPRRPGWRADEAREPGAAGPGGPGVRARCCRASVMAAGVLGWCGRECPGRRCGLRTRRAVRAGAGAVRLDRRRDRFPGAPLPPAIQALMRSRGVSRRV